MFFLSSDVDECLHRSCLNNATCLNTPGSFVCQCDAGWEGNICERGEVPFVCNPYLNSSLSLCCVWYNHVFYNAFIKNKTKIWWRKIFFTYYLLIIVCLWSTGKCLTVDDVFMFQTKMNVWTSLVKMMEPVLILLGHTSVNVLKAGLGPDVE